MRLLLVLLSVFWMANAPRATYAAASDARDQEIAAALVWLQADESGPLLAPDQEAVLWAALLAHQQAPRALARTTRWATLPPALYAPALNVAEHALSVDSPASVRLLLSKVLVDEANLSAEIRARANIAWWQSLVREGALDDAEREARRMQANQIKIPASLLREYVSQLRWRDKGAAAAWAAALPAESMTVLALVWDSLPREVALARWQALRPEDMTPTEAAWAWQCATLAQQDDLSVRAALVLLSKAGGTSPAVSTEQVWQSWVQIGTRLANRLQLVQGEDAPWLAAVESLSAADRWQAIPLMAALLSQPASATSVRPAWAQIIRGMGYGPALAAVLMRAPQPETLVSADDVTQLALALAPAPAAYSWWRVRLSMPEPRAFSPAQQLALAQAAAPVDAAQAQMAMRDAIADVSSRSTLLPIMHRILADWVQGEAANAARTAYPVWRDAWGEERDANTLLALAKLAVVAGVPAKGANDAAQAWRQFNAQKQTNLASRAHALMLFCLLSAGESIDALDANTPQAVNAPPATARKRK